MNEPCFFNALHLHGMQPSLPLKLSSENKRHVRHNNLRETVSNYIVANGICQWLVWRQSDARITECARIATNTKNNTGRLRLFKTRDREGMPWLFQILEVYSFFRIWVTSGRVDLVGWFVCDLFSFFFNKLFAARKIPLNKGYPQGKRLIWFYNSPEWLVGSASRNTLKERKRGQRP